MANRVQTALSKRALRLTKVSANCTFRETAKEVREDLSHPLFKDGEINSWPLNALIDSSVTIHTKCVLYITQKEDSCVPN